MNGVSQDLGIVMERRHLKCLSFRSCLSVRDYLRLKLLHLGRKGLELDVQLLLLLLGKRVKLEDNK